MASLNAFSMVHSRSTMPAAIAGVTRRRPHLPDWSGPGPQIRTLPRRISHESAFWRMRLRLLHHAPDWLAFAERHRPAQRTGEARVQIDTEQVIDRRGEILGTD